MNIGFAQFDMLLGLNKFVISKEWLFSGLILLVPLAIVIIYFDTRYRRIPNKIVLGALFYGLAISSFWSGWNGFGMSMGGCLLAFALMLILHFFGALGPGDVKLFGAVGSIIGIGLVLKTFLVIVFIGALLAIASMLYTGTALVTMQRVYFILVGLLPGWKMPRYEATPDRHTIPYGVAIMLGTLISLMIFPS